MTLAARHDTFAALHASGTFVLPNPWDAGSARVMAALGAQALATSSAAHAFTLGRPDMGTLTRDEALTHAQDILSATDLPVSGDYENGFGDTPDDVAETITRAGEIGLSGCGIEDTMMVPGNPAYAFEDAVERIRAAASAARALARPFILTARADGVMNGAYDLAEAIRRIQAFEAAGADCLYVPLPGDHAALKTVVSAVEKPVNALAAGPLKALDISDFAACGVRRISTGSQIARVTHQALVDATQSLLSRGSLEGLKHAASGDEIDRLLGEGTAHG